MPSDFFVCDTEDNSKGKIYWINFFNGDKHFPFDNIPAALKFLNNLPKTKIYCVNLEYDISNIFWNYLDQIKMMWGARMISVKYKKTYWLDTMNSWLLSVEKMGEYLGMPKGAFNPKNLKYCQRDCEITYEFVKRMLDLYDVEGIKPASTIGQSALQLWRANFFTDRIYKTEDDLIEFIKPAYFGGRVECFKIGKITGKINHADIKSMYPSVMQLKYPFPFKYVGKPDLKKEGVTYAKVKCDMQLPILPYRDIDNKQLLFPNGNFRGAWANNELRYFEKCGGKILKVLDGVTFDKPCCYPFKDYVDFLFTKRTETKNDFLKYLYKLLLNSLYGKFAQGNERTIIINQKEFDEMPIEKVPDKFKEFRGMYIFKIKENYPFYTNYIWSIYTTAYARIKLHKLLIQIKPENLLYTDTDSIFWKGEKEIFNYGSNLGELEYCGDYSDIDIRGNKFYSLGKMQKCKGIPKRLVMDFFDNGQVDYQKPLRLKEAIRRDLVPNIWIDYKKVNRIKYDKRVILKNGDTKPLTINH